MYIKPKDMFNLIEVAQDALTAIDNGERVPTEEEFILIRDALIEANKVLDLINPRKDSYIEYNYNNIKNEIESIVNQFPDNFYLVTINDTKKPESMYTLTKPLQEASGSYRINNVLFRGDYFALIPAVMFRINVETRSKEELTKKLINSCNSTYVQSKLNAYFGIDG